VLNKDKIKLIIFTTICLSTSQISAAVREYWIAADQVEWDYAPSFPLNLITGKPFTDEQLVFVGPGSVDDNSKGNLIGRIYRKSIFREYTQNFKSLKKREDKATHLGLLGPLIRAEVGDQLIVHFKNNTPFPASMHPHGVFYRKDAEGTPYHDGTNDKDKQDDRVLPGFTYSYHWEVPERAGPGPNDPSSIAWTYHSHINPSKDVNTGLVGIIIIVRKGQATADAAPKGIDREFITLFNIFDENDSKYLSLNYSQFTDGILSTKDELFVESNLMHTMNGLLWGNNTGYEMRVGEKVRWHVIGMGTEVDIHTPHWHGITLLHNGKRMDVTDIFPATSKTLDLYPDNPGIWMFHCHVNDHIQAGMIALFTINNRSTKE
jgi:FtsP/CotA-like multicopper oxidase with cupredoxin domain